MTKTKTQAPCPIDFRLDALVMVCKACGKRDSGPRDITPRRLAREFAQAARDARLKTRVITTSCMGLCPKKAIAVAVAARQAPPAQFAVASARQVPGTLRAAMGGTPDA